MVAAVVFPGAFYFTSRWGTTGIAITWILLYPLITFPFMWRTFVEIELPIGTYLRSLIPALRGCVVMTAMVLAVRLALPATLSLVTRFAMSVAAGVLAYVTILAFIDRERLRGFYAVVRSARTSK